MPSTQVQAAPAVRSRDELTTNEPGSGDERTAPRARPGDVVGGRYVLTMPLGEGARGPVFSARDRWSDADVAVRLMDDGPRAQAACMAALETGHPGFARLIDVGRERATLYLVTELARGETLARAVLRGDVEACAQVADQLLEALGFLHARGLFHGDLAPSGVRVEDAPGRVRARLLDAGFARPFGERAQSARTAYASPEALSNRPLDARSDLYALGTILYELLEGERPYGDPRDGDYLGRVLSGRMRAFRAPASVSLRPFVERLLARAPGGRFPDVTVARSALHAALPTGPFADPPDLREVRPCLVERDAAMDTLTGSAREALSGRAARVLLLGPHGVGRSTVLSRAAAAANVLGLVGITLTPDRAPGSTVLRDLVERLMEISDGDATALASLDAVTERGAPWGIALLDLAELVRKVSARRALWIGIDDADRLQPEVRQAIAFLARGESPVAWVFVSTGTSGCPVAPDTTVALEGLGHSQAETMFRRTFASVSDASRLAQRACLHGQVLPGDLWRGACALQSSGAMRQAAGTWTLSIDDEALTAVFAPRLPGADGPPPPKYLSSDRLRRVDPGAVRAAGDVGALDDIALYAEVDLTRGAAMLVAGQPAEALEKLTSAVDGFRRAGALNSLAGAYRELATALYQLGRWDEALARFESCAELCARLDDVPGRVHALRSLGSLWKDRGEYDRALTAFRLAAALAHARRLVRDEAAARGSLAETLMLSGDCSGARNELDAARTAAALVRDDNELLACARRAALLQLCEGEPTAALEAARSVARVALSRESVAARREEGSSWLLAAAAARAVGRAAQAREYVTRAVAALESAGTRVERAQADLEEARIHSAEGDLDAARACAARAARAFAEAGAARDLADAQALERRAGAARGDVAVELALAVTGADTTDAMLERVLERLLEFTGADRGLVVLLEGDAGPRVAASRSTRRTHRGMSPSLSSSIAERVIASRKPLVLTDLDEHGEPGARGSVREAESGLRAALAAPLLRGGRCLGLLYVDARENPADLARWGLWPLEVAASIVAPALDWLLARDRERERAEVLRGTAELLLDLVPTVDAALSLAVDEADLPARSALARTARRRCAALLAQADAVVELLDAPDAHHGGKLPVGESNGVDLAAAVRYAIDGLEGPDDGGLRLVAEFEPGLPSVRAEPAALVRALSQLVGALRGPSSGLIRSRAHACDDDGRGAVLGWRPGGGASHTRVRLTLEIDDAGGDHGGHRAPGIGDGGSVSLRLARRALSAFGASTMIEWSATGARAVVDFEAMHERAAGAA